jgi:hypothetical protein
VEQSLKFLIPVSILLPRVERKVKAQHTVCPRE